MFVKTFKTYKTTTTTASTAREAEEGAALNLLRIAQLGPPQGAPFPGFFFFAALPRQFFSAFTKPGAPWGPRSMIYMSYIHRNM